MIERFFLHNMYLEFHGWSPRKLLFDQRVVRVATSDALRTRNVMDWKVLIFKAKYYFSHLIHAHHFITTNIQGFSEI